MIITKSGYRALNCINCYQKYTYRLLVLTIIFFMFLPLPSHAQQVMSLTNAIDKGNLAVALHKSRVVRLDHPARRISVGNPGIADILILKSRQLYIIGKTLGTTNVVIWDQKSNILASFDVEVTHDLETLKYKLHELLPGEDIKVHSAQERLVLSGQVKNVIKMKAAEELAFSFLQECIQPDSNVVISDSSRKSDPVIIQQGAKSSPTGSQECKEGSVVNLMQVGGAQQVMLEIKVAEIARTVVKELDTDFNFINISGGTQFGGVSGGATWPNALLDTLDAAGNPVQREIPILGGGTPIGPVIDKYDPTTPSIDDKGLFLSRLTSEWYLQAAIEVSRQKGLAKILAEPVLTALTGQEAKFLSGGEFPIPVPQGDNRITIEFKEFGVGVKFIPVVLDSGRINLKMNVSVSELNSDNQVVLGVTNTASTFIIPSLTMRSTATSIELGDGQTIGISGLINDSVREVLDKLPGIGDVPILGTLFRSQQYISGQTELVIFVTPKLARPIAKEDIKLPTDSFIPPNDTEFYLLGKMEGSESRVKKMRPNSSIDSPKQAQNYGHDL